MSTTAMGMRPLNPLAPAPDRPAEHITQAAAGHRQHRTLPAVLGMVRDRQHTNPPERAYVLAGIVLPDHEGNDIRLGDLWRDGPVALVWLRHYG
jgi:hypothetical protein